jgi:hypothetical protein
MVFLDEDGVELIESTLDSLGSSFADGALCSGFNVNEGRHIFIKSLVIIYG